MKKQHPSFRMTLSFGEQIIKSKSNMKDAVLLLKSEIPFYLQSYTGEAKMLLEEENETGNYEYYDSNKFFLENGTFVSC